MNISGMSTVGTKVVSLGTITGELVWVNCASAVDKGVGGGMLSGKVGRCIDIWTCGVIMPWYASCTQLTIFWSNWQR